MTAEREGVDAGGRLLRVLDNAVERGSLTVEEGWAVMDALAAVARVWALVDDDETKSFVRKSNLRAALAPAPAADEGGGR